jgi:hypothetical protein
MAGKRAAFTPDYAARPAPLLLPLKGWFKAVIIPLFSAIFGVTFSPFECKVFQFWVQRYKQAIS